MLAFLDLRAFQDGLECRGGILLTDLATEPIEFRCTSSVRPTLLQKTLWGERLAVHIAAQLIGKPLVDSLLRRPSAVIVRNGDFLELRTLIALPLVHLSLDSNGAGASKGASTALDTQESLGSVSGRFGRVMVNVHPNHTQDLESVRDMLAEASDARDILEPFSRVSNALDLVQQQEAASTNKNPNA